MHDVENNPRTQLPAAVRLSAPGGVPDQLALPPRDDEEPGYVVHLPIRVADRAAAIALAGTIATSLSFLGAVDAGETTVSTADDQNNRHRVFCDLPLLDRSRCPRPYDHAGTCGEAVVEQRPVPQPAAGP
ncbi:hypothetical protein [Salinispora tropica]|uniref:Uncharacterized protein n=1 Tax=Salinispora tropica (strain ATCC BAA-916 / DSM 44818 / JCM 13857 / NBRC 105044 / CNB-440) TaxID=369723 RepID=A4XCX0_SALTO|nr:hypothetical protein [Salinispora tropica]ABP56777.1 hypothetical protein Strop_4349 [Salinispora tropica CNB-440]